MPLKEMLKLLKKHGWKVERKEGSHCQLFKNGKRITVPVHSNKVLKKGLEQRILKDAGLYGRL